MNTRRTIFKKLAKCLFLSLLVIGFQSCETEIPITDTVDPAFNFQIIGDGFNRTFDQETDFSRFQLNLRENTAYQFTYTGTDDGGVELIQWQIDTADNIIIETPINSPWTARDISPLSKMIEWRGFRNNPSTGNVLTGIFRTNRTGFQVFRFYVRDFGGERGSSNTSNGTLDLSIGNHATELINQ